MTDGYMPAWGIVLPGEDGWECAGDCGEEYPPEEKHYTHPQTGEWYCEFCAEREEWWEGRRK